MDRERAGVIAGETQGRSRFSVDGHGSAGFTASAPCSEWKGCSVDGINTGEEEPGDMGGTGSAVKDVVPGVGETGSAVNNVVPGVEGSLGANLV